VLEIKERAV